MDIVILKIIITALWLMVGYRASNVPLPAFLQHFMRWILEEELVKSLEMFKMVFVMLPYALLLLLGFSVVFILPLSLMWGFFQL